LSDSDDSDAQQKDDDDSGATNLVKVHVKHVPQRVTSVAYVSGKSEPLLPAVPHWKSIERLKLVVEDLSTGGGFLSHEAEEIRAAATRLLALIGQGHAEAEAEADLKRLRESGGRVS
jgi:hypothetical protein